MRLVSKTALAAKYGLCERTIDRWVRRGRDLGKVKVGGRTMFDEEKAAAAIVVAQTEAAA
jgi:hypothetical protein